MLDCFEVNNPHQYVAFVSKGEGFGFWDLGCASGNVLGIISVAEE